MVVLVMLGNDLTSELLGGPFQWRDVRERESERPSERRGGRAC